MKSECSCTGLRRLTRRITAIYDRHLAPDEISISQYSLLARIRALGPIANIELSAEMGMERSTMSRALKPLIAAELVETVAPPDEVGDKRSFALQLTAAGIDKWRAAKPKWQRAQQEISGLLGDTHYRELNELIDASYRKLADAHIETADTETAQPA